ncbi:MAG: hypothetical protein ABJB66_13075 [Gemmatimonadaceae bacterium]
MSESLVRSLLRGLAIAIAIFALIDPQLTSEHSVKPEISVLATDALADQALAKQVAEQLRTSFTVVDKTFGAAVATVVVGNRVPDNGSSLATPVFAVVPDGAGTRLNFDAIHTPTRAPFETRVPVVATLRARAASGKQVEVRLFVNESAVDVATRDIVGNDARIEIPLWFIPTVNGIVSLRAVASIKGESSSVTANSVVEIRERRWAVLFYDARPSWMSTFVRRAVERDQRFVVTSRVVTSNNVSIDAGRPPAGLNDGTINELYDAVVVGAPESLSERDLDGLSSFLRRRGGSVVMLFDEMKSGRYERLADFGAWTRQSNSQSTVIAGVGTDSVAMRATEWMWPARLPPSATVFARNNAQAGDSSTMHPMVWQTSVGAGRVVVSSALDAWKFRDAAQSGFEKFWQQVVGQAASASPAAIELRLPTTPVEPGELIDMQVTARDASLAEPTPNRSVRSSVSATLALVKGSERIRLWPTGAPGQFRGSFRAPDSSGSYRVNVAADGATADASFIVAAGPIARANPANSELLSAWTIAKGGHLIHAADLAKLPEELTRALHPTARRVSWHPMRSAWWLVPFALLLSAEWWMRRRRGLA